MKCDPNAPINPMFDAEGKQVSSGATIRQLFAAMMLQGLLSYGMISQSEKRAAEAIDFADALIAELNKE